MNEKWLYEVKLMLNVDAWVSAYVALDERDGWSAAVEAAKQAYRDQGVANVEAHGVRRIGLVHFKGEQWTSS